MRALHTLLLLLPFLPSVTPKRSPPPAATGWESGPWVTESPSAWDEPSYDPPQLVLEENQTVYSDPEGSEKWLETEEQLERRLSTKSITFSLT